MCMSDSNTKDVTVYYCPSNQLNISLENEKEQPFEGYNDFPYAFHSQWHIPHRLWLYLSLLCL